MADVIVSVGIEGDVSSYEAAVNKARALGKDWANDTAAVSTRATNSFNGVRDSISGIKSAMTGVRQFLAGDLVSAFNSFGKAGSKIGRVFAEGFSASTLAITGVVGVILAVASAAVIAYGNKIVGEAKRQADSAAAMVDRTKKAYDELKKSQQDPKDVAAADAAKGSDKRRITFLAEEAELDAADAADNESMAAKANRPDLILKYQAEKKAAQDRANKLRGRLGDIDRGGPIDVSKQFEDSEKRLQEQRELADKERAETRKRNAELIDKRREFQISKADTPEAANALKLKFLKEDQRTNRAQYDSARRGAKTDQAEDAQIRLLANAAEQLKVMQDIREQTKVAKQ